MSRRRTLYNNEPSDPFNGREYVDMGLPSGTLWAPYNVGADDMSNIPKKSDTVWAVNSGYFVQWGNINGGPKDANQTPSTNAYYDSSTRTYTKYNSSDGLTLLERCDDIANVIFGGEWVTPTMEQFWELVSTSNTSSAKVTAYNGVRNVTGYTFTSKTNGNVIYLPVYQGYKSGSGTGAVNNSNNDFAYYWTRTLSNYSNTYASSYLLRASSSSDVLRQYGVQVRPCINIS